MSEDYEYAHWKDIRKQADVWQLIIKRASLARLEHNYNEYGRSIDTLIHTLFKNERDKVKEHQNSLTMEDFLTYYDDLMEFIIDILESKGYLSRKYDEGIDKDIGDEDLDGLET